MDLNNYKGKQLVTKSLLFDHIADLDIYNMYMNGQPVVINTSMLSPLRQERNTSFGFFVKNGELLFNDFLLGGGDCIRFVELLFNESHTSALARVVNDFNLNDHFITAKYNKATTRRLISQDKLELLENSPDFRLTKRRRKWFKHDLIFWKKFGISLLTLRKFNVQPVTHIFMNEKIIKTDMYGYCFIEHKDGYETYKIYQPFSRDYKWLNNHTDEVWQGWTQLPEQGEQLIITKSLKDVMSLYNVIGVPAVSLQGETVKPKDSVIKELKSRFKKIYLLYDNDYDKEQNWGQIYANKFCQEYDIENLIIPSEYKCKDFSDLVKRHGKIKAHEIIEDLINNIIPF